MNSKAAAQMFRDMSANLHSAATNAFMVAHELDADVPIDPPPPPPPPPAGNTDELDVSTATIHNSPDIRNWTRTSRILFMEFRANGVHIEHTMQDVWPNTWGPAFALGDGIQYTLWIWFAVGGILNGSGCIQFWKGCDANGGPIDQCAANWYYARDRWNGMTGMQPRPGDTVGFCISQGDARNSGINERNERSQVIQIPFPRVGDSVRRPLSTVVVDRGIRAGAGGVLNSTGWSRHNGVWIHGEVQ